jgi:hypothetical protein
MPLSPICQVQDGVGPFVSTDNGVDVSPSTTVGIRLLDPSLVVEWYLEVIGTDELSATPTLTDVNAISNLVLTPNTVVTFTFPSSSGRAVGFRSTVTGTGGPLETTFGVYSLTSFSTRVGFVTETREGSVDFGWATKLNPLIRSSGGGGTDNFSYKTVPAGELVTIPEYQQMTVIGGLDLDGELDLVGELVLLEI